MVTSKAWQRLRAIEESPDFEALRQREFPFRAVALAVIDLRGRHELTQSELAERVGTTQSVISRLESGRHPVEVTLLAKIADALGAPLVVGFGEPVDLSGNAARRERASLGRAAEATADYVAEPQTSGDELLDRFNAVNTVKDFAASRSIAAEIARDPATPRRKVALALDAYNRGDHASAERWAAEALRGEMPSASVDTAALVRGRALIHLERAKAGLKALAGISPDSHLGWLVPAARADAFVELDTASKAIAESERALAMAPDVPEARYHAARTAWHADRVWDALDHVSIYRASDPDNVDGLILHGSILGFLGERNQAPGAYESALALFGRALPSGDCEVLRLYATTAARLANWKVAFTSGAKLLRHRDTTGTCSHQGSGRDHRHFVDQHIVPDAFEALGEHDPAELERAADDAERRFGGSPIVASQRALSRALGGDLAGTLGALGHSEASLAQAPANEQVIVAAAHYVRRNFAGAFDILKRVRPELIRPDGLLRLAECAAAVGELDEARSVLRDLADDEDTSGQVARVATAIFRAEHAAARTAKPRGVTELRWQSLTANDHNVAPRRSLWEGRHHRTTPMLDFLPTRSLPN